MESLDYRYHRVHTNKQLASYRTDGSVWIVVSHQDPQMAAAYNWITTCGHTEGTMCFRWVKPSVDGVDLPLPRTRVVPLASLHGQIDL